jgi:hypothetical protein
MTTRFWFVLRILALAIALVAIQRLLSLQVDLYEASQAAYPIIAANDDPERALAIMIKKIEYNNRFSVGVFFVNAILTIALVFAYRNSNDACKKNKL